MNTRPQTDYFSSFSQLGEKLAGAYQPDSVVTRLTDTLRELWQPERIVVVLFESDGRGARVAHTEGGDATTEDPIVEVIREHGVLVYPADEAAFDAPADAPASWLGGPIKAAGQLLGVVWIGDNQPARFSSEDLAAFRSVLALSGNALVSSHLFRLVTSAKREWARTVNAIPQALCIVGPRGRIQRANQAFAELVDVPLTALVGREWHSLFGPESAEIVARVLATAGSTGPRNLKRGSRQYSVTGHPAGASDERTTVLVFEDQTDKRTLQDQVAQAAKMSAIGQLIAGIAHDLNNPLASVVGFAEYLAESRDDTPGWIVEPLRAIHQEADRASQIVKNLLAFARKREGDKRPLAIAPILKSTVMLLRNQFMGQQIETELSVPDDLPPVEGNAPQLQQVFVNLITNAAQAIQNSGKPGKIRIAAEPWLDGVAVVVEDTGPGIPDEIVERVFEPFFTTKPDHDGTGLGLSICHGIVTEHGGRLQLVERTERGAAFRVELPGGGTVARTATEEIVEAPSLRVLIIDDEPPILHYMRAALEEWGHTVEVASDGAQGLTLAVQNTYDAIFTDLRMPNVGGREFFANLVRERPDLREHVIFCTGDTVGGDALSFLESSGRPHLKKPFSLSELRGILPTVRAATS